MILYTWLIKRFTPIRALVYGRGCKVLESLSTEPITSLQIYARPKAAMRPPEPSFKYMSFTTSPAQKIETNVRTFVSHNALNSPYNNPMPFIPFHCLTPCPACATSSNSSAPLPYTRRTRQHSPCFPLRRQRQPSLFPPLSSPHPEKNQARSLKLIRSSDTRPLQ
jgi:hypothetical protein